MLCPYGPVGWDCSIQWLYLYSGVRPATNECPWYDIKQSDGEALVMMDIWGIQNIPSLSSFAGQLWLGVVEPDLVLPMGQLELNSILKLNWLKYNYFYTYL